MAKIEGYLDGVFNNRICGWATDYYAQLEPLSILISINQEPLTTVKADVFRGDLERNGVGTGKYGFKVDLPESCRDKEELIIEAHVEGYDTALRKSGYLFKKNEDGNFLPNGSKPVTGIPLPLFWGKPPSQARQRSGRISSGHPTPAQEGERSVIFLATPTSATGSIWRILQILAHGKYTPLHFTNSYYQAGRVEDVRHAVPPEKNGIFLINTPQFFNRGLDLSKYRMILNIRDPRDLGCNQFHWEFQHPSPTKTEEELQAQRDRVSKLGVDRYSLDRDYNVFYDSFYHVVRNCPEDDYMFATYAGVCMAFDLFVERLSRFLGVTPNEEQKKLLELERADNLQDNPQWIGQEWKGSDTAPGRFMHELSPETIDILNKRYTKILDFLAEHDMPEVRDTYMAGR